MRRRTLRPMTRRDVLDLVLLAALWGGSFLFMRVAAPEFGPAPLAAVRVGVASAFLLPILAWHREGASLSAHAGAIAVTGVLNSAIPFALLAFATLHLTAGFTAVLNATTPMMGALVARVWLGDRLDAPRIAGLVIGFAGVAWLVGALIGGAVALAAALFLDTAALRRARRSGSRP